MDNSDRFNFVGRIFFSFDHALWISGSSRGDVDFHGVLSRRNFGRPRFNHGRWSGRDTSSEIHPPTVGCSGLSSHARRGSSRHQRSQYILGWRDENSEIGWLWLCRQDQGSYHHAWRASRLRWNPRYVLAWFAEQIYEATKNAAQRLKKCKLE